MADGENSAEVEIAPLGRAFRALVAFAVLVVLAAFVAQAVFDVFETAKPGDVDNLGARDLAWLVTGSSLLLALPARVWRTCPSRRRERLMWYFRGGIAVSALGVVLDIVFDLFISFLVLGAGLGRSFAWSGFIAFVVSLVAAPLALLFGCKRPP